MLKILEKLRKKKPDLTPAMARVWSVILENPGISVPELLESAQVSRRTLYLALNELEKAGWIRLERGGGRGKKTRIYPR